MDVNTLSRGLVAISGSGAHNDRQRIKATTPQILFELVDDELGQAARFFGSVAELGPVLFDELVQRRLLGTAAGVPVAANVVSVAAVASEAWCGAPHAQTPQWPGQTRGLAISATSPRSAHGESGEGGGIARPD